jgi:UDP-3-O-[3-hydroxymyristoyl] glucosamine N-acyltransferase
VIDPRAEVSIESSVGPFTAIGAGARIASGAEIGASCVIEAGVDVGPGCRIFPRVTLHSGTRLGARCIVQSGSVLGSDGFGYATDERGRHHRVPQRGGLSIGDDVEIGANVTIDRGSAADTVIGAGTKIDNLVHIAHNVTIGQNAFIVAQVGIAGSTSIGDHAVIAGQAGIVGHVRIGDRARLGAQAGVIGDVPADAEYSGYPARSHREQMRAYALFARLPELFERLKAVETRLKRE